ncbi:MAG: hypothetical protein JSU92_04855 [Deltaproteobacteria bacterium]|nr:MAG: hypothetical protein JSU92_04855 [Deltaproteobacteria bacterium]
MLDKIAYWYRVVKEMLRISYQVRPDMVIIVGIIILVIIGSIIGLIIYLKRRRARSKAQ